MWPAACDEVFRFNIGLPFVRASATSRISTAHAAHQPPHAANTSKADDTSPFALLLASTASKGQKNPAQDKNGQDDKSTDANAVKKDAPAQTQDAQPQADAKPVKTDNKSEDARTDDASAAAPAADPDAADPSSVPPAMMAATQQAAQAQGQTAAAISADDTVEAAANTGPNSGKPAAAPAAPAAAADTDTDVEDVAAPQDQTQARPAAANAKPDPRTAAQKPAAAKTGDRDAGTDGVKADDIKAGQAQANAANAPAPAADKPAPQTAHAADTNMSASAATGAPQANIPAAAPSVTQHVQVAAQPAPNLPALAVEIVSKSQAGAKQFDIRLDPPELGRVDVRLSIDATGKASAHLTADQPQTLDLLQKDVSVLTRALRDAGLNVSQDGLNFSLRQQAGDTHQGQNGGGRSAAGRGQILTASKSIDATQASAATRAPADGRLDIKV